MEKEMKSVVDERTVSAPISTLALGECRIEKITVLFYYFVRIASY